MTTLWRLLAKAHVCQSVIGLVLGITAWAATLVAFVIEAVAVASDVGVVGAGQLAEEQQDEEEGPRGGPAKEDSGVD